MNLEPGLVVLLGLQLVVGAGWVPVELQLPEPQTSTNILTNILKREMSFTKGYVILQKQISNLIPSHYLNNLYSKSLGEKQLIVIKLCSFCFSFATL